MKLTKGDSVALVSPIEMSESEVLPLMWKFKYDRKDRLFDMIDQTQPVLTIILELLQYFNIKCDESKLPTDQKQRSDGFKKFVDQYCTKLNNSNKHTDGNELNNSKLKSDRDLKSIPVLKMKKLIASGLVGVWRDIRTCDLCVVPSVPLLDQHTTANKW